MSKATQQYKRTLSGSIGAGMGAVFGGSGKQYFILEHKLNSKYHKAGEAQEIIVDQIEIGRDPKCQVRFDESFETVSRRHAAIVRSGDKWKLMQLSTTNPTYLNGKPVQQEWYLQSGDEIQLSIGGPRLGFIIPTGNKATVGSIGLSRRLSLFRQQALKPYKTAIAALGILLILSIGGLSTWKIIGDKEWNNKFAKAEADRIEAEGIHQRAIDDLMTKNDSIKNDLVSEKERSNKMEKDFNSRLRNMQGQIDNSPISINKGDLNNAAIENCLPYIYFIVVNKIEVTLPTGETTDIKTGWSGTGFLLNDGRFVTARHVTEGWFFVVDGGEIDKDMLLLNKIANNGGKVVAHFKAFSSSGDQFSFKSDQFICNRSHDETVTDEDGAIVKIARLDNTDWAYMRVNKSGGLLFDSNKSSNLERGTKLTVLGFPLGLGANSSSDINPIYGSGVVANNGLNNGLIVTTETSYEQGNSGGPVFYTDPSGNLSVVGIVSAIAGRSTGFIIPLSAVR